MMLKTKATVRQHPIDKILESGLIYKSNSIFVLPITLLKEKRALNTKW